MSLVHEPKFLMAFFLEHKIFFWIVFFFRKENFFGQTGCRPPSQLDRPGTPMCPKSGPWAKYSQRSNFVWPAAWFKTMKRIQPVALCWAQCSTGKKKRKSCVATIDIIYTCDHRHYIHIYVCLISLVATQLFFLSFFSWVALRPKTICIYITIISILLQWYYTKKNVL